MPKARVDSLDVLKSFRAALWKFSESASAALAEAEGEVHRMLVWLETEQLTYWQSQIRKRHETVEKCKEAYRQKTLFKDAAGTRSSGFDERKALEKAQRALTEAEEKHANVKRYVRVLQKELQNYTGAVQRFAGDVAMELPNAAAKLEKMEEQLERYVALAAPEESRAAKAVGREESMSRGSAGESAEAQGVDWHRAAPTAEDRARAVEAESANFLTTATPINGPARVAIAALDVKRQAPEAKQTIAVSAEVTNSDNIYLHRMAAGGADSGWFIGPAGVDASAGPIVRLPVDRLLDVRPDLREILSLPAGFVILIGAGSITSVYNSDGKDLWNKRR
jgi:hypothetical protein